MTRDDLERRDGEPEVLAAGGVLIRSQDGELHVAVIHRPKYMDWSLPKGKLEPGEGWQEAALREVREETGFRCELGLELPSVAYLDRKGRHKLVRYWLMDPTDGGFEPHGEVDELRWLSGSEAEEQLTYPHDRDVVNDALSKVRSQ